MTASIPVATVAVPTWRGASQLDGCLAAVARQQFPGGEFEVLVFNNGDDRDVAALLREHYPSVGVLSSPVNIGFAAACNRMADAASGKHLAFLNDDTVPAEDWLAALVDGLETSPDDVAAVGGILHDREGVRLDFAGGVVTFDGHALQCDHGRLLAGWSAPATGTEIPFACGGNMLIRREQFMVAGGFDERFFAYYEDVDLGWRLWSQGARITVAPEAVARHVGAATSARLGVYQRGRLFEWNAYQVACKNYEQELWDRVEPVVLATLIGRTTHALRGAPPGGGLLRWREDPAVVPPDQSHEVLPRAQPRWQRRSFPSAAQRAAQRLAGAVTAAAARLYPWPALWVTDPRAIAQLQVLDRIAGGTAALRARRVQVQSTRVRPDAEIFARFPRYVVPTYPGDTETLAEVTGRLPAQLRATVATFAELGIAT